MPTAIGDATVTAIARHYIMPEVTDIVYNSNPFFFRLNAAKKIIPGGTQLEYPLMTSRFSAGGPYSGYDVLTMTPSDTVKNGVWGWKQHYVPVVVDGLTLIKVDSPLAIANLIRMQFEQAEMEMAQNLGVGVYSDGSTNPKEIDGLQLAVDSTGTYAGLARSTNAGIAAQEDGSTSTLTLTSLNSMHGNTRKGGRAASLIASRQDNYNRYWKLAIDKANIFLEPVAKDSSMADLGWGGLLFNGVPWIVDDNMFDGANTSNSAILMLNEDYTHLAVSPRADFYLEDFQTPINQDVMAAKLLWAGNLIVRNPARQGKMTALTA
jgi:hypothetical protein